MAVYSPRRDQLWYFALKLAEEETKFIQDALLEEEHGQRIQLKYNQLVSNLSCLGDIVAMMYQKEKLTLRELEHIQNLQSTPIRANEELLSIIARKPRDVYEYLLTLIKHTNQLHLYQMLISGDGACDKTNGEDASDHKDLICRNFMWLSEKLDTESGLISLLYQQDVLSLREKERILCTNDTYQRNEHLLGLLSKKSPRDFEHFLEALEESGQGHLAEKLRNPADSNAESVPTMSICKELLLKEPCELHILPSASQKVNPPETLPKQEQKRVPSRSVSRTITPPKPDTQSTAYDFDVKSIHHDSRNTENVATCIYRMTKGTTLESRLKGLEPNLKTEIAIKVTSVSLLYLDKPADNFKTSFQIILQECHRIRKGTVAKTVESNMELEQLRESVSQYSVAASLNEVYQKQLHSMQQELVSERLQIKEERMHLEEKIDSLKTEIHSEKAKCKRYEEEKLHNNTVITKLEERLEKTDCDKQFFQQQMHELIARLPAYEYKLQLPKETIKKLYDDTILLRIEGDKLKNVCERLSKTEETITELKIELRNAEETNRDLLDRLQEKERSLDLADDEETFDPFKSQNKTLTEKALESDKSLKLQEELETEKQQRKELKDKLSFATEHLHPQLGDKHMIPVSQESYVLGINHQFLVENIDSDRLIDLLSERNCIMEEEQSHLNNQPYNFFKNEALIHWMRAINYQQDKGLKVLECLREAGQRFVLALLLEGGVIIRSKISTKLVKKRQSFVGLDKSKTLSTTIKSSEYVDSIEVAIVEKLNQPQGLPLSSSQNATSELSGDGIVIIPYCHQEEKGIVIWFWCQSEHAQRNLQSMYASGTLLKKLYKLFKNVSPDSGSSVEELLVPSSVTIFANDFTKSKIVVDFKPDPKLFLTIRTKAAKTTYAAIYALAVLANEIFVISMKNSEVEVYNRTTLQFQRNFTVKNLKEPRDIVSCSKNNCLYIIDGKPFGQPMEILRVDINGNILKKIWRGNDWGRLSVSDEANLILAVLDKGKLMEITPDGQLVREITLTVSKPWHAAKLTGDLFVVAYNSFKEGRICIVDNTGKLLISPVYDTRSKFLPINVVVNRDGSLLAVNETNGEILLLSSSLEFQRKLISRMHGLRHPRRIFVDELNDRILVCDNLENGGCILVFDISDLKKHGLF